ncbi:MAG: GNAT family protein [Planctomycetota bacterium]
MSAVESKPRRGVGLRWRERAVATGELVFLRFPLRRDRAEFLELRRASRVHLEPWEPLPPRGFDAWGDDVFERELRNRRSAGQHRLLICRRGDGAIVGRVAVAPIERGAIQTARLGYWIGEPHCGNGYMTEALRLVTRYCFRSLGLHRVSADVQPHNAASKRAVLRAGFRYEGFSPKLVQIAGRWADHERYAMTADDPQPK